MPAISRLITNLTPPALSALDMLWQYRGSIAVVVGLLMLVMIIDSLGALHSELARSHRTLNTIARLLDQATAAPAADAPAEPIAADADGWRVD